jgi:hypothetical protein
VLAGMHETKATQGLMERMVCAGLCVPLFSERQVCEIDAETDAACCFCTVY